jgi:hypothetical protein
LEWIIAREMVVMKVKERRRKKAEKGLGQIQKSTEWNGVQQCTMHMGVTIINY